MADKPRAVRMMGWMHGRGRQAEQLQWPYPPHPGVHMQPASAAVRPGLHLGGQMVRCKMEMTGAIRHNMMQHDAMNASCK